MKHGLAIFLFSLACLAQTRTVGVGSLDNWKPYNTVAVPASYKGKAALHVTEGKAAADGEKLVSLTGADFNDGTLEIELSGAPGSGAVQDARGFVGLAFRVSPDLLKYECVYLRPTNGRADDQTRRNHSVQYISHPDFTWAKLRKESPSQYETYADMAPGEWLKLKIEVKGTKARVWVNDAPQPTMLVNDLKQGDTHGGIALWIGPGTDAYFGALKIGR